ncbi:MAG: thiosulfate sulfurtransferase [Chloroflexi bacterium]|nr:thiosulfate sulfurtransferase [Chloroflexota bacterium]
MTLTVGATVIGMPELAASLGDPAVVVVDARSAGAFNGWRLAGEARGGHIRGAVDFPLAWTRRLDAQGLRPILATKGITTRKTVVVYDAGGGGESRALAEWLERLGYADVRVYVPGLRDWAADERLPMDRLPRYERLVPPAWLNQVLLGRQPATASGAGFKVLEAGWQQSGHDEYAQAHLPGACYLDLAALEELPVWNCKPPRDLEAVLLRHGITHRTTVVLYGKNQMAAARAVALLMYAGVEDVRLLNGGFRAWQDAGYGVEQGVNDPAPVPSFGTTVPANPRFLIDMAGAKAILAAEDGLLVSIRSWAEHVGQTSGYPYVEKKGRIPGDVWGHSGSHAHALEDFRNPDGTMRNYHEIAANWAAWGITPDKRVAFYCGTGWRASEAFFAAYLMGWPNIAVYDGGWFEWSLDPTNPVISPS